VVLGDAAAVKPQLDSLDLGPVTIVRQEELP